MSTSTKIARQENAMKTTWDHHCLRCLVPCLALVQSESVPSKNFASVVKVATNYLQMAS